MNEMFTIGRIVNTHGVKGELRILPTTDDVKRFGKLKKVYIVRKDMKEYEIETIRYHKNFVLIKFKGIETMDEAELFKNSLIKINREDGLPLAQDEYYIGDLYDMQVITEEGRILGLITDIIYTGSNDVYVVQEPTTKKEILIPAIKQCIKNVDVAKKQMLVELLEGLE
ncbi:MAG: ribosome maturation factor RimM [Cellulosilyticaceae bacterium]